MNCCFSSPRIDSLEKANYMMHLGKKVTLYTLKVFCYKLYINRVRHNYHQKKFVAVTHMHNKVIITPLLN